MERLALGAVIAIGPASSFIAALAMVLTIIAIGVDRRPGLLP
jgi:hypothetical protein